MSSSGKGQSVVEDADDTDTAWEAARAGSRSDTGRVIVEDFVDFESEFTLLTVRHDEGTTFCPPIGHTQQGGDYRTSWQPHDLTDEQLSAAQRMAREVTDGLGGHGIFGVEFFIQDGEVVFSELSPRPHDTGLVTMASQRYSQFDLHLRAILGLPIPDVSVERPGASTALVADEPLDDPGFLGVDAALSTPETDLRLFGKPKSYAGRRMGVALATATDTDTARSRTREMIDTIDIVDEN